MTRSPGTMPAASVAAESGLELICGVELSTRPETARGCKRERSVHVLGYFLLSAPKPEFRTWLETQQASRRKRNLDLVAKAVRTGCEHLVDAMRRCTGVIRLGGRTLRRCFSRRAMCPACRKPLTGTSLMTHRQAWSAMNRRWKKVSAGSWKPVAWRRSRIP